MDGLNTLKIKGQCPFCGADLTSYLKLGVLRYCPNCGKCLWFPTREEKEDLK